MKAGYEVMAPIWVAGEKEGNSEFGILVHYGDSIDKIDDGLGIRV